MGPAALTRVGRPVTLRQLLTHTAGLDEDDMLGMGGARAGRPSCEPARGCRSRIPVPASPRMGTCGRSRRGGHGCTASRWPRGRRSRSGSCSSPWPAPGGWTSPRTACSARSARCTGSTSPTGSGRGPWASPGRASSSRSSPGSCSRPPRRPWR
ncbi:hypothetical protein DMB42_48995 [Nonomuraea sp. WAC 01424]|nr:hypothetical protein DMB42_48995 [Nonomuraea sp. WAC 01424]